MLSFNFLRWLRSWFSSQVRTIRNRPRLRLCVEGLEDRITPATFTWDGSSDNNWNNPANWVENAAPSALGVDQDLIFDLTNDPGAGVSTNNIPGVQIQSITIDGSGFILNGSAITFGDGALNGDIKLNSGSSEIALNINTDTLAAGLNGTRSIDVVTGAQLTYSGQWTGSAGVTKTGSGTLFLTNNNSGFTGLFTLAAVPLSVVNISHANALGASAPTDTLQGTVVRSAPRLEINNVTGTINENLLVGGNGNNEGALLNVAGNNVWGGNVRAGHHARSLRHPHWHFAGNLGRDQL